MFDKCFLFWNESKNQWLLMGKEAERKRCNGLRQVETTQQKRIPYSYWDKSRKKKKNDFLRMKHMLLVRHCCCIRTTRPRKFALQFEILQCQINTYMVTFFTFRYSFGERIFHVWCFTIKFNLIIQIKKSCQVNFTARSQASIWIENHSIKFIKHQCTFY